MMITVNGDHLSDDEDEEVVVSEENFVFQDECHRIQLLNSLNMMRKNRTFCDVVLHVGNTELYGHRAILASVSSKLMELFSVDDEEKTTAPQGHTVQITLNSNPHFESNILEKIIEYAYTSRLEVQGHEVRSVYLAASYLKMNTIAKECAKHLIKNLTVENCIDIRSLRGISEKKSFVCQLDEFISSQFAKLREHPSFLSLPCVQIEILSQTRQEMNLVPGDSLAHLVMDWIRRLFKSSGEAEKKRYYISEAERLHSSSAVVEPETSLSNSTNRILKSKNNEIVNVVEPSPKKDELKKMKKKLKKEKSAAEVQVENKNDEPVIDEIQMMKKIKKRKITSSNELLEDETEPNNMKKKLKKSLTDEANLNTSNHSAESDKNFPKKSKLKKKKSSTNETETKVGTSVNDSTDRPNQDARDTRTVFCGNVPINFNRKKLKRLFRSVGFVERLWTRGAKPATDKISKKTAVIAKLLPKEHPPLIVHVLFKTTADANAALQLNGTIFEDHRLRVTPSRVKTFNQNKGVFVGNLDLKITEDELYDMFSKCGDIVNARVVRDANTGIGKGFGYVNFISADSVELALRLNEEKLNNRELRVQRLWGDRKMKKVLKNRELTALKTNLLNQKTKKKKKGKNESSSHKSPDKFQKKKKSNPSEMKKKVLARKLTNPVKKKEQKAK